MLNRCRSPNDGRAAKWVLDLWMGSSPSSAPNRISHFQVPAIPSLALAHSSRSYLAGSIHLKPASLRLITLHHDWLRFPIPAIKQSIHCFLKVVSLVCLLLALIIFALDFRWFMMIKSSILLSAIINHYRTGL